MKRSSLRAGIHRIARGVALLLAGLSVLPCQAAAPQTGTTVLPAGRSNDSCTISGANDLRPLPTLSPDPAGTLALSITATRETGTVMIGDLAVRDVPVLSLVPDGGTRLQVVNPATLARSDLPARCLSSAAMLYAGTIWALRQSDVLRIRLTSALDFKRGELPEPVAGGMSCRGANIHTHGLLVSPPRRSGPNGEDGAGDSAFDFAVPAADAAMMGDPCAAGGRHDMAMGMDPLHRMVPGVLGYRTQIPGMAGVSGRGDGQHPSGVFWYHPHVHGYSGPLTDGAMSGVITIGDLGDYVCAQQGADCVPPTAVTLRTLILRDAEVVPDSDGWRLSHDRLYAMEDACALSPGRDAERQGQCDDWKGRRWLFTVNGQRYPRIADVDPARAEVWRIVNASPNMSYRLRLRPLDDPTGSAALPLRLLSLEGAAPAPAATTNPGEVRELLLMPASRAEIAISLPRAGGSYVLEQQQFSTGGDTWPHALLAQVRFPAGTPDDPAARLRLRRQAAEVAPAPRFVSSGDEPACDFTPDAVRRIFLVARPSFTDDRRRPVKFGLIASIERPGAATLMFDADGRPRAMSRASWDDLLKRDSDAPAFAHNPFGTVCTYLGHSETWIIDNYTGEAHNFHIHQSEFRLAREHRNDPAFFSPTPQNAIGALQRTSDEAIGVADGAGRDAMEASLYHDTIPVPRGMSLGGRGCDGSPLNDRCRPGRITLVIRFDREAQVGTFVYHCHILQHEDDGMMAIVRVLCPPGDTSCKRRHADAVGPVG